jgi:hypothetical protein
MSKPLRLRYPTPPPEFDRSTFDRHTFLEKINGTYGVKAYWEPRRPWWYIPPPSTAKLQPVANFVRRLVTIKRKPKKDLGIENIPVRGNQDSGDDENVFVRGQETRGRTHGSTVRPPYYPLPPSHFRL